MKIMLATDGLEPAQGGLDLIEKLANSDNTELTVLSVQTHPIYYDEDLWERLDLPVPSAENIARTAACKLEDSGFKATWEVAEGSAGAEIIRAVEWEDYELTVMGGGRESWLGNLLLGSVSTHVLHSSPTSVLIVHRSNPDPHGRILIGVDGSQQARRAVKDVVGFADPARVHVTVASVIHETVVVRPHATCIFASASWRRPMRASGWQARCSNTPALRSMSSHSAVTRRRHCSRSQRATKSTW